MVLFEIALEDAVLVSPGGRLRVLSPRPAPPPGARALRPKEERAQKDYVYLPGYKVKADFPPSGLEPVFVCRGMVDGNNWDEMHDEILRLEREAKRAAVKAKRLSEYRGMDMVSHFVRVPEHGGAFWMLARGVDGSCYVRTDPLGRQPVLCHRVSHDEFEEARKERGDVAAQRPSSSSDAEPPQSRCDWLFAPSSNPRCPWPNLTDDGWHLHHPRHIIRVDGETGAIDDAAATAPTRGWATAPDETRLLPVVPPPLLVPPSLKIKPAPGAWNDDLTPKQYRKPRPFELPLRFTEEPNVPAWACEGLLEASDALSESLLAAVRSAAWEARDRGRPVGVLFSGGVSSLAILACLTRWNVPCVAAHACFTGSTRVPPDRAHAIDAAKALGARLEVVDVSTPHEIAAALSRVANAVFEPERVDKAAGSLALYFATAALKRADCVCAFSGHGGEEVCNGRARFARKPDDADPLGKSELRALHRRTLQRDFAIGAMHGVPVYHPFLSSYVVPTAHAFPAKCKALPVALGVLRADRPGGARDRFPTEKRCLRAALERGPFADGLCPRRCTRRPRVDAAEGSGFDIALRVAAAHILSSASSFEDDHPKAPESLSASAVASATRRAASLDPDALERDAVERQRPRIWNNQHSYGGGGAPSRPKTRRADDDAGVVVGAGPPRSVLPPRSISTLPKPTLYPRKDRYALLYTSGANSAAAYFSFRTSRPGASFAAVVPFSSRFGVASDRTSGRRHARLEAPPDPDPDEAYTVSMRHAAERFADALGLPLWNHGVPAYTSRTRYVKGKKETASRFAAALRTLREDYGVEGIVVGHVSDVDALEYAEDAADLAGLACVAPRWGARESAAEALLENKTRVSSPGESRGKENERRFSASKTSESSGGVVIHPKHRASALICTRGTPASLGCVIRDAAEARALVEARGGADATDGDAVETALDFVAAESAAFGPRRVARINAEAEGGGGCEVREVKWENVRVVGACAMPRAVADIASR